MGPFEPQIREEGVGEGSPVHLGTPALGSIILSPTQHLSEDRYFLEGESL